MTRIVARHIARHLAGNPIVVVQNMTGAGTLIAANHLYNRSKPDGLTIGVWVGSLTLQRFLGGTGMDFDPLKFAGRNVMTGAHCFGCTAGAGSSCGGSVVTIHHKRR